MFGDAKHAGEAKDKGVSAYHPLIDYIVNVLRDLGEALKREGHNGRDDKKSMEEFFGLCRCWIYQLLESEFHIIGF